MGLLPAHHAGSGSQGRQVIGDSEGVSRAETEAVREPVGEELQRQRHELPPHQPPQPDAGGRVQEARDVEAKEGEALRSSCQGNNLCSEVRITHSKYYLYML